MKSKKKALFIDAYSSSHVGNDVLLDSSAQLLYRIWPEIELHVQAQVPESFGETVKIPGITKTMLSDIPQGGSTISKIFWLLRITVFMLVQCLNAVTFKLPPHWLALPGIRRNAMKDIHNADLVISIGGEMINDSFRKTLPMYMFMFWLASRFGKKVIIFPQSIGPLRRRWARWLVAKVLSRCTVVIARDKPSHDELLSLGLSGAQACFCPDVGVAQPQASREEAEQALRELGVNLDDKKVWIGVIVSSWVEEGIASRNYLDVLADSLLEMAEQNDLGVVFMPANMPVYGNDSSDYDAAKRVISAVECKVACYILKPAVYSARRYKAMTARMDMVISTRMHASILSTMAGTPTITINTQRKLLGYMSNIGQADLSIDIADLTAEKLVGCQKRCINDAEAIRQQLFDVRDSIEEQLFKFGEELKSITGK
ncbi:polysaccharide pyruvyl transferase WcaK-like protein [Marinobacterium halophilum]|uniref:Polysaccharide pyruvyl transferase WcaK-like protein n=1 Tax=Marinobacterium halophilum TaxID=267374 RepID=A0A2P8F271_9GAMM|nr:polysaccharide pyruvyl transferase family protein [Marinobacterium halophilum]PSL15796.1 polysaccharide pyruvyl transferase WcaK-like protein [Marinobacterium halophilum]